MSIITAYFVRTGFRQKLRTAMLMFWLPAMVVAVLPALVTALAQDSPLSLTGRGAVLLFAVAVFLWTWHFLVRNRAGSSSPPTTHQTPLETSQDKGSNSVSRTPLLDKIDLPSELRALPRSALQKLADEVREDLIDVVSVTGGHLGSNLSVVELTVALHYVFDTPKDKLIWDTGHQAYSHKILTGRRPRMQTLRQHSGISGFTKRSESEYDCFGAAHSSTSISAALGFATARDMKGEKHNVVCVTGDGAFSGGMAYEAMNNAGATNARLIVVLNDNDTSVAPMVDGMTAYLARLVSSRPYRGIRRLFKRIAHHLPRSMEIGARRVEHYARGMVTGGTLFEELGFYYVGPIDGHNLRHLIPVLESVRDMNNGPILVHVVTQKGKGYAPAEVSKDKYHGVGKFNVLTGELKKSNSKGPTYTRVFADALIAEAKKDSRIVAITAAMPAGTGLDRFAKEFPGRCFDVGIAEQHAVTFAAGLAAEGMKPFCAIYSTFLQRAFDQVVHDVALQSLPVRFAIDRAGLVGADDPSHSGVFDLAYLTCIPNFVVMAAADEVELMHMVATCAAIDDGPSAVRYPRGEAIGLERPQAGTPLEIGKGRVLREGNSIAILSLGTRLAEALSAADKLSVYGLSATVADARFAKPLDTDLLLHLAKNHQVLVTIEEGSRGGFGASVLQTLAENGQQDVKVKCLFLPDRYIEPDYPERSYASAGLNSDGVVHSVLGVLGIDSHPFDDHLSSGGVDYPKILTDPLMEGGSTAAKMVWLDRYRRKRR